MRFVIILAVLAGGSMTSYACLLRRAPVLDYFPLAAGNQWHYRLVTTVTQNGRTDTTTTADYHHWIGETTVLNDGKPAAMRIWRSEVTVRDPNLGDSTFSQAETTWFRKTRSAVYRYTAKSGAPDSIMLLPVAVDQNWKSQGVSYWVAAREDISVNGRDYIGCWRIKTFSPGDVAPVNSWFAPNVGLVRMLAERIYGNKTIRTDYFLTTANIKSR